MMIQLNYAGFGYCQTPDDLQYRNNMRAQHQMYRTTSTTTTNTNINIPANLEVRRERGERVINNGNNWKLFLLLSFY